MSRLGSAAAVATVPAAASFDELVAEALAQELPGWNFAWLEGRNIQAPTSWSYDERVLSAAAGAGRLLDIGTGGGETLATMRPPAAWTVAVEAYPPNVPIAQARLAPLGIPVVAVQEGVHNQYGPDHDPGGPHPERRLPFRDESFDLVVSRHSGFSTSEVFRILRPDGRLVTQQVGADNNPALNEWLPGPRQEWPTDHHPPPPSLEEAGFVIVADLEEKPRSTFTDIGGVVFYLKAIPWPLPDFTVDRYRPQLLALEDHIEQNGGLHTHYRRS